MDDFTLPQDLEAERALLGSMLLEPAAMQRGLELVNADALTLQEHRIIFSALARMAETDTPVDVVTLKHDLERRGQLDNAGGVDLLTTLAESVPSALHVEHYAGVVDLHCRRRRLWYAGKTLQDAALAVDGDPDAAIEVAQNTLTTITTGQSGCRPILTCMADVEPRQVQWLWPGRIPLGRVTLLVGRPGEGKSFVSTDLAARVSTGSPWPDNTDCPRGSVVFITAEDDPHDTVRPRLDAHHADVRRVHLLSGIRDKGRELTFTLADVGVLETALQQVEDCKLVIVDPIGSFIGGRTDTSSDNEVRAVLTPVARLAERYGAAVLIVAHRRKSSSSNADDLALGSRAFTGLARATWHLSSDPQDKNRRLLLPGKNNLAAVVGGLAFSIAGDPARIYWERDPVDQHADDALAQENAGHKRPGPAATSRQAAGDWLSSQLAMGRMRASEIEAHAGEVGLSWRTVQRAADDLGVKREKASFGGGWWWILPDSAEDANPRCQAPVERGNLATWHLRITDPENANSTCQDTEDDKMPDSSKPGILGNNAGGGGPHHGQ